jgi:ubiquinone/menaquinone biosynthesis C-methylase UbiE
VSVAEAERWNDQAERYDSVYDDADGRGRLVHARLRTALEWLGDGPGSVLDAGMGGGRLVEELAARGWTVTGTDVSEAMVELARKRAPHLRDSLLVAPIEQLPFEAGRFDAVTALGVVEFSDIHAALQELARVLKPGSLAVVSWPNFGGLYTAWRGGVLYRLVRAVGRSAPPPARHPIAASAFAALLADAGLHVERRAWLTPRGGSAGPRLGRLVAAQVVLAARKAG